MTTLRSNNLRHSRLLLAAVLVFALGMIGGMLRNADLVGADAAAITTLVHRAGRVAGAETSTFPGPVTVTIALPGNPLTAMVDIAEPISVYNLLRLVAKQSSLTIDAGAGGNGAAVIRSIEETAPSDGQAWVARIGNDPVTDLDAPVVVADDAVSLAVEP